MNHTAHRTLYDILGIPCGVGVDHIKSSYCLLSKRTALTDGAYGVLSDPVQKQQYDAELWAAARIKPAPEPQPNEICNPLTREQERRFRTSRPEADEWLRIAKENFLSLQNPTISYQCGTSSDSDACGGGFTFFWVSGSDHALLLRDESDDMFWSMLDKNYLTQEELRLSLLRWWPALEERDDVDLGEIEMVDGRSVTPSAIPSYPESRVLYLP